jgi:hypothetical protein
VPGQWRCASCDSLLLVFHKLTSCEVLHSGMPTELASTSLYLAMAFSSQIVGLPEVFSGMGAGVDLLTRHGDGEG